MYRYKALERRRQPDQLDSPMILASPRGWVAVFVVLITAASVALWGVLGHIPRTLEVRGILGYPGGIVDIQAPASGTVMSLLDGSATAVQRGASVGTILLPDGRSVPLASPVTGRLVSRSVTDGQLVAEGTRVVQVEAVGGQQDPLQVFLFVDAATVPEVREQQAVSFAVPGVSPRTFGRLRGTVVSIGSYPLTDAELTSITGSSGEALGASAGGVGPRLVTVQLLPDQRTPSGYRWTSAGGPPIRLASRTPVDGQVEIGTISPLSMLVGG